MLAFRVEIGEYKHGDRISHHGKDYVKERYFYGDSRSLAESLLERHRPRFRPKRSGSLFCFKYIEDAVNFFWHEPNMKIYMVKVRDSFRGSLFLVNSLYGIDSNIYARPKKENDWHKKKLGEMRRIAKDYWKGLKKGSRTSYEILTRNTVKVVKRIELNELDRISLHLMSQELITTVPYEEFESIVKKLTRLKINFEIDENHKIRILRKR